MSEMKKLVRRPSAIAIAIRAWLLVLGALAANADGFSVIEPARGKTVREMLELTKARVAEVLKKDGSVACLVKATGERELDRELGSYASLGGYVFVDPVEPRFMDAAVAETEKRILETRRTPRAARPDLMRFPVEEFLPVRKQIGAAADGWFDAVFLGGPNLALLCVDWGGGKASHDAMKASDYRVLCAAHRRSPGSQVALWTAKNGALDGFRTGLVVLSPFGGENWRDAPAETEAALGELVRIVREKQPQARIVVLGELPIGDDPTRHPRLKVVEKDAAIRAVCAREGATFVDLQKICTDERNAIRIDRLNPKAGGLTAAAFDALYVELKPHLAAAKKVRAKGTPCGFTAPRVADGLPPASGDVKSITVPYPPRGATPIETLCAIGLTVRELRTRCPKAKLFLLPNADVPESELRCLADGNAVFYIGATDPERAEAIRRRAEAVEPRPAAARPAMRRDQPWWDRMAAKRREIADNAGKGFDIVWVGDSITHQWESEKHGGPKVFGEYFGKYRTLNLGIGCDYTQHVLWRLLYDGELDGYAAKVVTLMIGTNNCESKDTVEETAEGIWRIVEVIREKQPQATLVLMPIFPRGGSPKYVYRLRNNKVNGLLKARADKAADPRIVWLDFNAKFLAPDGTLPPDVMRDTLHPDEKGYRIWAESISKVLR